MNSSEYSTIPATAKTLGLLPQRFQHTFLIAHLRLGVGEYKLQLLLKHRAHEIVQHNFHVARMDVEQVHRMASLADNRHV